MDGGFTKAWRILAALLALIFGAVVFPDRNLFPRFAQGSSSDGPTITSLTVGPSIGSGKVQVAFTAGSFSSPTNYEYSTDGGTTWIARSPAATTSPLTISGLSDCTSYSIAIRAIKSSEQSGSSSSWTTMPRGHDYVFINNLMRFGTGSQSSVNITNGNLEQPFYSYNTGSS